MNVSSSFSSFGVFPFLLLGFLVLTLTLDDAQAKDDARTTKDGVKVKAGLDVWSIVSDIVGSRRTVLLLASLGPRLLLIVSAPSQTGLTSDAVVFEQAASTLTGTSLTLTSGQLLKDKWPQMTLSTGSLAVLSDANAHYLAIVNSGQLHLFNLETKALIPGQPITNSNSQNFFGKTILLSTPEVMTVYSLFHVESNIEMKGGTFDGSAWTSFTKVQQIIVDYHYLCNSGQGMFSWNFESNPCQQPLSWKITAGAIIDSSVYLIDASSIIKFDKSALTANPKTNTTFKRISFSTFWAKPPTLPPTTTHKSTTHHSKLGLYIGLALIPFFIIIILGVIVYCCFCRPSKTPLTKSYQPIKEGSKEGFVRLGDDGLPDYKWSTPKWGAFEHKLRPGNSAVRTTPPPNDVKGGYWLKKKSSLVHIPTKMTPMPKKRTSAGARKTSKQSGSKQSLNKRQTSRQVRDASQSRNVGYF